MSDMKIDATTVRHVSIDLAVFTMMFFAWQGNWMAEILVAGWFWLLTVFLMVMALGLHIALARYHVLDELTQEQFEAVKTVAADTVKPWSWWERVSIPLEIVGLYYLGFVLTATAYLAACVWLKWYVRGRLIQTFVNRG